MGDRVLLCFGVSTGKVVVQRFDTEFKRNGELVAQYFGACSNFGQLNCVSKYCAPAGREKEEMGKKLL